MLSFARSYMQGKTFTDDYNRANGAVDNGWLFKGDNAASIVSNQVGFTSTGNLFAAYQWPDTLVTDRQSVEILPGNMVATGGSFEGTAVIFGWIRANPDYTDGTVFSIEKSSTTVCKLYDATGYKSITQRAASSTFTLGAGDTFKCTAEGNLYTLYRNGSSICSWPDTGGLVSQANRNVGFGLQVFGGSGFTNVSAFLDAWQAKDY